MCVKYAPNSVAVRATLEGVTQVGDAFEEPVALIEHEEHECERVRFPVTRHVLVPKPTGLLTVESLRHHKRRAHPLFDVLCEKLDEGAGTPLRVRHEQLDRGTYTQIAAVDVRGHDGHTRNNPLVLLEYVVLTHLFLHRCGWYNV